MRGKSASNDEVGSGHRAKDGAHGSRDKVETARSTAIGSPNPALERWCSSPAVWGRRRGGKARDLGKNHKTQARAGTPEERGILNQSANASKISAPFNTKTHQKGAAESCLLTNLAGR